MYAVDFIGDMNKSSATRPIVTKEDCVQWFRDVLDRLHLRKAHVMGLSYGGFLALLFAAHLPDRIDKLVTISPAASLLRQKLQFFVRCLLAGLSPTTRRLNGLMDYMMAEGNTVHPILRNQFVIAMQNCIPRIKVFASYLPDEELRRVQCPTLLLVGKHEVQYDPIRAIDRGRRLIPNLQAHLIPNGGHGLPLELPDTVNSLVIDFLKP